MSISSLQPMMASRTAADKSNFIRFIVLSVVYFIQKVQSEFMFLKLITCKYTLIFPKNNKNSFTDFNLFKMTVWHWWWLPVNKFTPFTINTNRRISCYEISKSKNKKIWVILYSTIKSRSVSFFMFLLLESFDIRENMCWCWQEDGERILPAIFLTMAKQST